MDLTAEQTQVRRLAKLLRYGVTVALIGCVATWLLMSAALWLGHPTLQLGNEVTSVQVGMANTATDNLLLAWLWLNIDIAIVSYGLYRLRALLLGYEAGELFSRRAANHLSAFALCMVLREVVDLLASFISHAAMSLNTGSLRLVLVGSVFWLLSRVLAAAYTIADDHGRIV